MPKITTQKEFERLMNKLAEAWTTQDTQAGVSCFRKNAIYMEPPDIQLYIGHEQLRPFFDALEPGTDMKFHNLCFNESTQTGMGEYTFSMSGADVADVGIAVVELEQGKISKWREYQRKGPADFGNFIAYEGKNFQWHIGNYP